MTQQVFRVSRGRTLHIIHETLTGKNRVHDVWTLCTTVAWASGEREKGTSTCTECLDLDNPLKLHSADRKYLARVIANDPTLTYINRTVNENTAKRMLVRRDFITVDDQLTRRGRVVAADWLEHPANMADALGIAHRRGPLGIYSLCGEQTWPMEDMSLARYGRLRALDLHVTCVRCLSAPT